jgi:hypothetical protein
MITATQTRHVVSAFLAARSAGDMQSAALYLAPEFTFQSPMMRFDDPTAYLASHRDFAQVLTRIDMISELYGEGEGTLVYDLNTATPAGTQRTAEHFRLAGQKIASILLIFDATPWRPMLKTLGIVDD